jgi:hypothetical protein
MRKRILETLRIFVDRSPNLPYPIPVVNIHLYIYI